MATRRYQQLIQAIQQTRTKARQDFDDCVMVAGKVVDEFRAMLEVPPEIDLKDVVRVRPIVGRPDERDGAFYSISGALRSSDDDDDDGDRYHLGLLLSVAMPDGSPTQRVLLRLTFESIGKSQYEIEYAKSLPKLVVDGGNPASVTDFTDALFTCLLRFFQGENLEGGPVIPPEEQN